MDKEVIKQMFQAIKKGDLDFIKELLETNEGLLYETNIWGTWLHNAASYGQYEISEYFITCGIDVNINAGLSEASALEAAAHKGNIDIARLLLQHGAKLDVSTAGRNPLLSAIYGGQLEMVKFLVEEGIDLTPQYEIGGDSGVDAYKYSKMYGKSDIEVYLKEKMGICIEEEKPKKKWDPLERLKKVYQTGKLECKLDKQVFVKIFKDAVKDIFPKIKEKYEGQAIYGISFEIGNTVQRIYAEDFSTFIYLNTEERYQEAIAKCDEKERNYYRFSAWAEWLCENISSPFLNELQNYLWNNSLAFGGKISAAMEKELAEDVKKWFKDVELDIETLHEEEVLNIRFWMAETLGELRAEGFWEQQGNKDIYVIPFEGEDEISVEELKATYMEMDRECHGQEYLQYLKTK